MVRCDHLYLIQFLQTLREKHLLGDLLISESFQRLFLTWQQKGFLLLYFLLLCRNDSSQVRIETFYCNFDWLCALKWIIYGCLSHEMGCFTNTHRIRFGALFELGSKFALTFHLPLIFSLFTFNFSLYLLFPSLITLEKGTFLSILVRKGFAFCHQIWFKSALYHFKMLIFDLFLQLLSFSSPLLSFGHSVKMIAYGKLLTFTWFQIILWILCERKHVSIDHLGCGCSWSILQIVVKI